MKDNNIVNNIVKNVGKDCNRCTDQEDEGYTAIGEFRDLDSDFAYGIPVCGGCGGLGRQYDNDSFRPRVSAITALRFQYCPIAGEAPVDKRVAALKGFRESVISLFRDYSRLDSNISQDCFARKITDGCLDVLLDYEQRELDKVN